MKMNKIAMACGIAMLSMSAHTMAEVSMNIGVTSNYIWRGLTQSDDAAAISGGLDWSHDSGVYLGTWISNVDFGPGSSPYELDLYGGYAGEAGDFGYDVGLIYYAYDSDDDANFSELYFNGSWKFLSAGLAYALSADDAVEAVEEDFYYHIGASFDLPQDYSVGATVGFIEPDGNTDDADSYVHYQVDLSKSAGDFGDVTLSLSDTDIDDDDVKFFVSWNKGF